MLRDLLTQKSVNKKTVTVLDTLEHVDSGNMNFKIGRPSSVYQLFSKRDLNSQNVAKIGQNWPKLTDFQTFCRLFSRFSQVVEHIRDILKTNTVKNETFSKKSKNSIFGHF
jgi:hypothetical protein